jgi:hypothetical protein
MTLSVTMVNSFCERVIPVENTDAPPIKSDRLATHCIERHQLLKLGMCICNKKKERIILQNYNYLRGTWSRSWLRHCATSRKVASSIPDGVIVIFY